MDDDIELRIQEIRACGLRARFAEDWFVCAVVALDLAIRRAAVAMISGGSRERRAHARGTPCRS